MAAKLLIALSLTAVAFAQDAGPDQTRSIALNVPAGMPLRLYLTKRVSKRLNAPVEAKLLTPVYAFDHEVIPAGAQVFGHIVRLQPVSKWMRFKAIMGGDFTPLHIAEIQFTSLRQADGSTLELHTTASPGLNSLAPLIPPKTPVSPLSTQTTPSDSAGIVSTAKQTAKDAVNAQIERIKSIPEIVSAPGKKEWLYDYAMSRLPYHPQYIRSRTRFDAELESPLAFGSETVAQDYLALLGLQPAQGSIAHARLLTPLDSVSSKAGERVEAVLETPLFSADHRLVLPEGTLVNGVVATARGARMFHRGGRLRFAFQNIDLSPQTSELMAQPIEAPLKSQAAQSSEKAEKPVQFATRGTLSAAESANATVKVDKEGGVQATESKTRLIGTAVAAMVMRRVADNDAIRGTLGQGRNIGRRTLGGGMGFGLLGIIAAQLSPSVVATVFGYYGLAWSVYSTIVARGKEVEFGRNTVIDIGFNQRTDTTKLKGEGAAAPPK